MEIKKSFLLGNPIYDNKNFLNKLTKEYLDLTNIHFKKNPKLNIFSKKIMTKYQINEKINPIKPILKPTKNRKGKGFNVLSCPNKKYLKQFNFNKNHVNSIHSKILNQKGVKSIITTIKYNNIKNSINQLKVENNKFQANQKENKSNNFINHSIGSKTFYAPFHINKNNSSKNNTKLNNCYQVIHLKPEKTEGNEKNDFKNKLRLTSNNSWFTKTMMMPKRKLESLPKMKVKNFKEKVKNEKEQIKTFFRLSKNSIRHIQSVYNANNNNKLEYKQKNLTSFEISSVPGTERGIQKINQDTYLVIPKVNNTHNAKIFGVFDGHGINSDKLSQEIRDYFIEFFSDKNKYEKEIIIDSNYRISSDENLEKIYKHITKNNFKEINQLFKDINSKLHEKYQDNDFCLKTGSTLNILIVLNDKKTQALNKLISINLGDCKSILINEDNQVIELNKRHTPNDLEEKERIEKNGGEISRVDWADYGPLRIYYKNKRYPGLAMTRAFGDFNAEDLGFNTIPDIKEYDIYEKKPKIIILATDGIWQFLTNEQVKNIILPYYDEDNISGGIQKLVGNARKMWETKNPRFIDDISVIVLFFK